MMKKNKISKLLPSVEIKNSYIIKKHEFFKESRNKIIYAPSRTGMSFFFNQLLLNR